MHVQARALVHTHVCKCVCTGGMGQTQLTDVPHSSQAQCATHVPKMLTFPSHQLGSSVNLRSPGVSRHHSKVQRLLAQETVQILTQVLQLHMAQDIEAALLEIIDKVDEAGAASGVLHHQQHLRAPELDVVLPHIQHQQVLPHLEDGGRETGEEPFLFH